ncbi:MAG: S-methyl-5'-thioinosine phosphorylase [Woeseia sp.]|nr:S-methyl-5'-thioinosine phosphorylase [Woeseia sp.]
MTDRVPQFAIIAGSGFASFGEDAPGLDISTRFGRPSSTIRQLRYDDHSVYVLLRHGDDHSIAPHAINYRANLAALKLLKVSDVIALNTVGVIREQARPGQLAVPAQLIDFTWGRAHTIYDSPTAELDHIDFTEPFAPALRDSLMAASRAADAECHDGGVYGVTQGPRLETAAEVDRYERAGVDYLGMTLMPEASVARELGIALAPLCLIVNYAAGRSDSSIHADIAENTMTAKLQAMRVMKHFLDEPVNPNPS